MVVVSADQSVCKKQKKLEITDIVQAHDNMTLEILELEPGETCTLLYIHVNLILFWINLTKHCA